MTRGETERRFPRSLYATGSEPDPRFSLANERTFLAWLRSGLALMAAGVALHALRLPIEHAPRAAASVLLILLGVAASGNGWVAWFRAERALRAGRPLPGPSMAAASLTLGVMVAGVIVLVGLLAA